MQPKIFTQPKAILYTPDCLLFPCQQKNELAPPALRAREMELSTLKVFGEPTADSEAFLS